MAPRKTTTKKDPAAVPKKTYIVLVSDYDTLRQCNCGVTYTDYNKALADAKQHAIVNETATAVVEVISTVIISGIQVVEGASDKMFD